MLELLSKFVDFNMLINYLNINTISVGLKKFKNHQQKVGPLLGTDFILLAFKTELVKLCL